MEDAKKLFNDCWNTKNDTLKETPSATSQCHLDTKEKSKVVCGDETVSPKVKSKFDMDLDNFLIPKNKFRLHELSKNSHIPYRTHLNVSRKNFIYLKPIRKQYIYRFWEYLYRFFQKKKGVKQYLNLCCYII
ncbi:hypothetical protein HanIR_Chr09g0400031 [Helianthus annuus]|nr:hypothetical protein HanIR_Chr09g0400031 [Helianthus annuus]